MTDELTKDDVTLVPAPYPAHIVNQPGLDVGDKAMAICGKKWRVTLLWADIPRDHPICRDCVDTAVNCMQDSADAIRNNVEALLRVERSVRQAVDVALAVNSLTEVIDSTQAYADERAEKRRRKEELEDAKALVKASKRKKGKDGKESPEG